MDESAERPSAQFNDSDSLIKLGQKLFELRDYTPIPLVLIMLGLSEPSASSATIGTIVVMLGELLRIYSVAFIGCLSRTRNVKTTGGDLITHGPFGIVRNPLYCGNFLITIGFAIYGGKFWIIVLATAMFVFQYYAIVAFEESLLKARFGGEFEAYKKLVPAWIPKRWPELTELEWPQTFTPALRSERRTLTGIVVMLLLLMFVGG